MDLILRNAYVLGHSEAAAQVDVGIDRGRIAAIAPGLAAGGREIDLGGRLVAPSFIETHIHLDKSCILERCKSEKGDLEEAIEQVALAKKQFTADDCYERAKRTLEKSILNGTAHMRTHVEVDPGVGLRGIEGVMRLVDEYKWAIDIEVCVFPQEGLLNNPGTDELMVAALKRGATVVGAAPYTDSNPHGQIDRVFEMAREFDADIDMHLDFGNKIGGRLAAAGVAVTVLPSTDLYLMGRHRDHNVTRGVVAVHKLLRQGVNCSLSTNNVLNPFTPFGDCSLIRMANLYANICHVGARDDIRECFDMITRRSAKLLRRDDYGIAVGKSADLVVLDCSAPEQAVAELAIPLYGFKRGRMTFSRTPAELFRP